ncbi:unnamed protein product [Diatraea saccharalis]|uniref:Uncharacterized protein n=1 Tax=Diatraea saccharalis TaxID=40085 RepID=A0A9N9R407_9NEOP|nr:unnamed protein product [Diatraea saccharalis]
MGVYEGTIRQPPPQRSRGPSILSNADGAFPSVQVVTHSYSHSVPRKRGLAEWMWTLTGHNREPAVKRDNVGELQIMLPSQITDQSHSGDVCLLEESPYRILRVSEMFIALRIFIYSSLHSIKIIQMADLMPRAFSTSQPEGMMDLHVRR